MLNTNSVKRVNSVGSVERDAASISDCIFFLSADLKSFFTFVTTKRCHYFALFKNEWKWLFMIFSINIDFWKPLHHRICLHTSKSERKQIYYKRDSYITVVLCRRSIEIVLLARHIFHSGSIKVRCMHWNLCKVHLTEWRLILPLTWKSSWHLLLSVEIFKILQNVEIWQSTLNTCSSKVQYSWKSLILQLPVIEKKLNAIIYRYLDRWCIWTAANSNSVFTNEGFDLEFRWDEISSDLTCNALFSNTLSTFWLLHAVSTFEDFLP